LFSLGLVLYEMATGQRAFSGKTATAIRDAVVHVPAMPPRQLRPGLPPELERIILKAMEKDRGLRYQTASEIAGDLINLATQVAAPSQPTNLPAAKAVAVSVARYRSWKVVIPALLLLIGGVAGAYFYRSALAARITDKDTIVIADFANSTGDTIFDEALKQGL